MLEENIPYCKQFYDALKSDSRKGDFYHLVRKDMSETEIMSTEEEIKRYTKTQWKKIVKIKVTELAFKNLINKNSTKEKQNI